MHNFCKERGLPAGQLVQALDGQGLVQLGLQSRKLSKDEAIEFCEYLIAWCTNNGVVLSLKE